MGDLTMPAPAIRFDGATGAVQRPPRLGEHTTEVLQGAGFEPDRIAELLRSGAAVQWRPPS
jgi:crotonobetainyl-CoA:carnitine CoA-transferase CaiB-like acyl-CoA transferase